MKRITVIRDSGDKVGDDLVVPLAGHEGVLLQRGRNEIDGAAAKAEGALTVKHRTGLMPGNLIQVVDEDAGITYRAKITGVEHKIARREVSTTLRIERFL